MSLKDQIRDAVNKFLNDVDNIENEVVQVAKEELEEALEEVRPEIRAKIDEAMKEAVASISIKSIVIDSEKIRESLQNQVETYVEDDEDEEIKEILMENICAELKQTKILPLLSGIKDENR